MVRHWCEEDTALVDCHGRRCLSHFSPFHITSAPSSWSLPSNSYSLTPSPRALLTLLSSLSLSTSTTAAAMAAYPSPSSFKSSEGRRSQEEPPFVARARHHSGPFTPRHEGLGGDPGGFIRSHDRPPRSSVRLHISRGETDSGVRSPTEGSKEDEGEWRCFRLSMRSHRREGIVEWA